MQNAALSSVGLTDWRYQRLPVPPELLAATVRSLAGAGFRGANVTVPHKQAVLGLAEQATERARQIGAANTLLFEPDGSIRADNTDAPGLIDALPMSPRGRSVLVLGAGGSARAVVWALLGAGAHPVSVWNRTPGRARGLAAELGAEAVSQPVPADLLVNCTTIGLRSDARLKDLPVQVDVLARFVCVVDLVYSTFETPLITAARAAGTQVVDGLELLVRQGALSFEQFTGRPAPLDVMRAAIRR